MDKIDLTYTQYIVMLLLFEHNSLTVKELGEKLYLDSGTLTPLLKKLESKGFITRVRSSVDERNLDIEVTEKGMALREKALSVPKEIAKCLDLTEVEAMTLYKLAYKVIANTQKKEGEENGSCQCE